MSDNTADIKAVITAEDKASAVLANFGAKTIAIGNLISDGIEHLISGFEDLGKEVINFGEESINAVSELGVQVRGLTQETGISAVSASEWLAVFERFGITGQAAGVAIKTFSKQLAETLDVNHTSSTGFEELGINVKDASGTAKDFNTLLLNVADAFHTLGPGLDRTAISVQLFGRQGANLLPLLNNGAAGIQALEDGAKKMGLVLTEQNVGAVSEFITKQADMNEAVSGLKLQIGLGLMPIVSQVITHILAWVNANGGITTIVQTRVIPVIQEFVKWLKENKQNIQDVISAIIDFGKFVALVIKAAADVLKFFHDDVSQWVIDISNFFNQLGQNIYQWYWDLTQWFRDIKHDISIALTGVETIIEAPFIAAFNVIKSGIQDVINTFNRVKNDISSAPSSIVSGIKSVIPNLPHFADGGVVPGAIGAPTLAVVHGGETVIPNGGSVGGINLSVNVGVYAGSNIEKRKLALDLYRSLQDIAASRNTTVNELIGT